MDVTSGALCLKDYIYFTMDVRLQMIMGTEKQLPCNGGRRFDSAKLNELIDEAYLNPRFWAAVHAVPKIERIIKFHFTDDCDNCDTDRNSDNKSNDGISSSKKLLLADVWVSRVFRGELSKKYSRSSWRVTVQNELK